jgi:hypothetical protein
VAQVLTADPAGPPPAPLTLRAAIRNTHRATGTQLSFEVSKRWGEVRHCDPAVHVIRPLFCRIFASLPTCALVLSVLPK